MPFNSVSLTQHEGTASALYTELRETQLAKLPPASSGVQEQETGSKVKARLQPRYSGEVGGYPERRLTSLCHNDHPGMLYNTCRN